MSLGRGVRIGLGVLLILLGSAAIFSKVDEQVLGAWAGIGGKFPFFPFVLIFGGLWVALGGHLRGTK